MKADAPDSTDAKTRRGHAALGVAGFLAGFLLVLFWPWGPRIQQPIQYNHQKHLEAGLECSTCHTMYASTPWAGLPTVETCSMCHQEPLTEAPEEARLVEFIQQDQALPWRQVNQLPTHVYFSHQTHTGSAGIDCSTCHGEMQQRTVPPPEPYFDWTMDACLNCHVERRASEDCNACHR